MLATPGDFFMRIISLLATMVIASSASAQAAPTVPPVAFEEGATAACEANGDRIFSVMERAVEDVARISSRKLSKNDRGFLEALSAVPTLTYNTYCTEGRIEPNLAKCAVFRDVTYRLYDTIAYNIVSGWHSEKLGAKMDVSLARGKELLVATREALAFALMRACK